MLDGVNVGALQSVASSLRGGKACTFEPGKYIGKGAVMGSANYHAWITFDDGEKWLARFPKTVFSDVPPNLVEYLVLSEFATLKFLESTDVPAPKAYGFGLASDAENRVGVNYLLMGALPGEPYDSYLATPEQKHHVLEQVGGILQTLSKHPFKTAGSLVWHDGQVSVDAVASNRWVALGKHGPFGTAREYYTHITEEYLDLVADGQLYYEYPVEAFAFYKLLQSKIPLLLDQRPDEGFYLKHVDDKGDHLLVDEEYNVVGIIDWQFARVVPAREAFGPSLLTADLDDLYSGRGRLSDADLELARILRRVGSGLAGNMDGELVRRFHMGLASGLSREDVRDILAGALASTQEDTEIVDIRRWMKEQVSLLAEDPRWEKVKALALELGNWDDEWDGWDRRPG